MHTCALKLTICYYSQKKTLSLCVIPILDQCWDCIGTFMTQHWDHTGTVLKCVYNSGTSLGANLSQCWVAILGLFWNPNTVPSLGTTLSQARDQFCPNIVPMNTCYLGIGSSTTDFYMRSMEASISCRNCRRLIINVSNLTFCHR